MGRLKYWRGFIAALAAVITLGVVYYYGAVYKDKNAEQALYSVVLYEDSPNEWDTLMEGINQAEKDFEVDIRYVTMGNARTAKEQMDMIKREIQDGANGILLAAVDSEGIGQYLKDDEFSVPVVTVETGIESEMPKTEAHISADNYAMGQMLGEKILKDMEKEGKKETVAVIREYMERDSVKERYEGLMAALHEGGVETVARSRQKGDFNLSLYIGEVMREYRYITALDKYTTEEAAKAWDQYRYEFDRTVAPVSADKRLVKVYGIGNTAQTVSDLDNGKTEAFVYQNEFNMGYNGIKALVEKQEKGYVAEEYDIMYKLVTRETLYESENERLLFSNQ